MANYLKYLWIVGILMDNKDNKNWFKYMLWGSTIATTLAGLVAAGYFLGDYLDSAANTDPWLNIVLMILGVILGLLYMIVSLSKLG